MSKLYWLIVQNGLEQVQAFPFGEAKEVFEILWYIKKEKFSIHKSCQFLSDSFNWVDFSCLKSFRERLQKYQQRDGEQYTDIVVFSIGKDGIFYAEDIETSPRAITIDEVVEKLNA